jgi:hypothetical protein
MKGGPGMWLCQVCGSEDGWPDGRLSKDVLCPICAEWATIPRLFMLMERQAACHEDEIISIAGDLEKLDNGFHRTDVTLKGVN